MYIQSRSVDSCYSINDQKAQETSQSRLSQNRTCMCRHYGPMSPRKKLQGRCIIPFFFIYMPHWCCFGQILLGSWWITPWWQCLVCHLQGGLHQVSNNIWATLTQLITSHQNKFEDAIYGQKDCNMQPSAAKDIARHLGSETKQRDKVLTFWPIGRPIRKCIRCQPQWLSSIWAFQQLVRRHLSKSLAVFSKTQAILGPKHSNLCAQTVEQTLRLKDRHLPLGPLYAELCGVIERHLVEWILSVLLYFTPLKVPLWNQINCRQLCIIYVQMYKNIHLYVCLSPFHPFFFFFFQILGIPAGFRNHRILSPPEHQEHPKDFFPKRCCCSVPRTFGISRKSGSREPSWQVPNWKRMKSTLIFNSVTESWLIFLTEPHCFFSDARVPKSLSSLRVLVCGNVAWVEFDCSIFWLEPRSWSVRLQY